MSWELILLWCSFLPWISHRTMLLVVVSWVHNTYGLVRLYWLLDKGTWKLKTGGFFDCVGYDYRSYMYPYEVQYTVLIRMSQPSFAVTLWRWQSPHNSPQISPGLSRSATGTSHVNWSFHPALYPSLCFDVRTTRSLQWSLLLLDSLLRRFMTSLTTRQKPNKNRDWKFANAC